MLDDRPEDKPAPLLLSEADARRTLGVGYQSLRRLRREGLIREVHIGSRVLIPMSELQRFIADQLQAQGDALKTLMQGNGAPAHG